MDENKPDLLTEIFEKAEQSTPPPQRPRFEYPPEDETSPPPPPAEHQDGPPSSSPPDGPVDKKKTAVSTVLLPWLCMVLGAALLVLGICVLQVTGMNRRLDELQQSVEAVQSIDKLQEEIVLLQEEISKYKTILQTFSDTQRTNEQLKEDLKSNSTRASMLSIQKKWADYLFYVGQFMAHEDYPMAAFVVALSADLYYFDLVYVDSERVPFNPAQLAQYQTYRQELIRRGYLWESPDLSSIPLNSQPPDDYRFGFTERCNPSQNDDMAALGILWCALDAYFIEGNNNAASQYLYASPLAGRNYQERVERLASDFTLEQFQLMKDGLVELDALHIEDDGTMTMGGWTHTQEGYSLPFELPKSALAYIPIGY